VFTHLFLGTGRVDDCPNCFYDWLRPIPGGLTEAVRAIAVLLGTIDRQID
jgi:hypothetical protein